MDPTRAEVVSFRRKFGLTYPLVLDPGEKVGKRYRLEGHPTGVLIDRKGIVRFVHTGFLEGEEKQLEAAIRAVLAGEEPPKGDL
jgi:peroxiredoxin